VRVGLSYDPLRLSPCSGDLLTQIARMIFLFEKKKSIILARQTLKYQSKILKQHFKKKKKNIALKFA
jgi:hypothetical protein